LQLRGSIALFFMLELEEAVSRILAFVPSAQQEHIPLNEADGRVLAQPVASPVDLPPFDNSAMDGYAVRAEDVLAAKAEAPVRLRLAGKVAAGEVFSGEIGPGACVRLFTGSPLPRGADCVVMQEDTAVDEGNPGILLVFDAARPWENVRFRGADVRVGAPLAAAGQALSAGHLSLLAASGLTHVAVGRQPIVGLIATGSELQEPGQPLHPGQIYESNRIGLAALIRHAGAKPVVFAVVPDTLEATKQALALAFSQCDLIVSAGGASVGEFDLIKPALTQLGGEVEFWKVAIKPGRPFIFGRFQQKLFFGLPGNPVSALVTLLLLVRPALRSWQGATDIHLRGFSGVLAEPLANPGSRRHFMRVRLDPKGAVFLAGAQGSHLLSSFAGAHGLLDVPPQTSLPAGDSVRVRVWEL
jgi:molybdopterin molybdotransferase